jgi:conjugation system TraG family ATPase
MKPIPIQKIWPILEAKNDFIIGRNGDVTVAMEITKPEALSLSAEECEAFHATFTKAIGILSNNTTLHLQDCYTGAIFRPDIGQQEPETMLAQSSNSHFHERPWRYHRSFLFITRKFGSSKPPTSAMSSLLRKRLTPDFVIEPLILKHFMNECGQFTTLLTEGGIECRLLTAEELRGTIDTTGLLEQYLSLNPVHLLPLLEDIHLQKDGIRVGNKLVSLFTVADAEHLPQQCTPHRRDERLSTATTLFATGFASPLAAQLDVDHVYNQFIILDDPRPKLKKLETRMRRLKSLAGSRENRVTCEDIEGYLNQAARPGQRPIKTHFNVMAWTDNPGERLALQSKVVAAMVRMGVAPHHETVGCAQIWWAGIPGNAGDLPVNETFDSFVDTAVCWFVPESNGRNSQSPFGLRLGDRQTGIPLHVDLSDEPMRRGLITNRNKFVLGGSGSGKSFFINLLVRSYFEQDAHLVLVDVGGSYKTLCELLGGTYLAYSDEQPIRFNPFRLADGETMDIEKKESIKALLLALWKRSSETYTQAEYVALSNALQEYYRRLETEPALFPCFDSFYEWMQTEFGPRLEAEGLREKDFDLQNFLYVLKPYHKGGEYDWLLNAREQQNFLHQRLIVFELDAIKDHPILFPVVTIVIMDVYISKMRKLKGVRKVILLEEAWKAIAKEGMSEYIRYLFKTVRKFFGEAIVVTQEVEDIISSPVVKNTIINNADCKILLDQSKFINRFDQIQELLGLTEKDKTMVLSLNKANDPTKKYKEVFIGLGTGHGRVYRVEVSLEEYLVYTTEESERVKVADYSRRRGGIRKGIPALAKDIRSGAVRLLMAAALVAAFLLAPNGRASAQIEVITEAIKEVLETADLKLQQLQTQTLYLQDAQKSLENSMAGGLLDDITGWVQQTEDLYSEYYTELWQVKSALSTYSKVQTMIDKQIALVHEYEEACSSVQRDPHFSAAELTHILNVYGGILNASIRNIGQIKLVIEAFVTQMDDAGRLRIIDQTAAGIDRNYTDLQRFTQENTLLSLERAKDEADIQTIKTLYGIQ